MKTEYLTILITTGQARNTEIEQKPVSGLHLLTKLSHGQRLLLSAACNLPHTAALSHLAVSNTNYMIYGKYVKNNATIIVLA